MSLFGKISVHEKNQCTKGSEVGSEGSEVGPGGSEVGPGGLRWARGSEVGSGGSEWISEGSEWVPETQSPKENCPVLSFFSSFPHDKQTKIVQMTINIVTLLQFIPIILPFMFLGRQRAFAARGEHENL